MPKLETRKPSQEEGEAWLASYADLMTLLLCFFILLFAMSDRDPGKLEEVAQALSKSFKGLAEPNEKEVISKVGINHEIKEIRALHMVVSLLGLGDTPEAVKKIEDAYIKDQNNRTIENIIKKDLLGIGKGLKFSTSKKDDAVIKLNIPSDILFQSGQEILSKESSNMLRKISASLKSIENLVSIEVVGHTDSVPLSKNSPFGDNRGLSALRANFVAKELSKFGVKEKYIKISGEGSLKPLFLEDINSPLLQENRRKNRRVEIIIKRKIEDSK